MNFNSAVSFTASQTFSCFIEFDSDFGNNSFSQITRRFDVEKMKQDFMGCGGRVKEFQNYYSHAEEKMLLPDNPSSVDNWWELHLLVDRDTILYKQRKENHCHQSGPKMDLLRMTKRKIWQVPLITSLNSKNSGPCLV